MKELFTPFRNWRVIVLAVLVMVAAELILSDCDGMVYLLFTKGVGFGLAYIMVYLLFTKGVGFGLAYIIYRLGKYWNAKGKINELMALVEEE